MTSEIQTNSLTDGLVAYYPFNGNANDESGNGNNGIIYGATLVADRFGNSDSCLNFNGVNSYIKVSNGSPFDFTNDFSVSVWVNPSTNQNFISTLLEKSHDSPSPCEWAMEQVEASTNFYRAIYRDSLTNTWISLNNGVFLTPNIWNHYVVIKHSNTLTSYLNNNLVLTISGASSNVISNGNFPLFIGAYGGHDRFFSGKIDDIRIYNRAITEDEVRTSFNDLAPSISPTKAPTLFLTMAPQTDYRGISTLREGQAPNECFESDISFDVAGKSESFTYITTEQSSGYNYVLSNKYTGSAYFGALKFANMALEASVSHYNFKAVSASSYSTTIGVVHSLPIGFINPKLNNLGEEIYKANSAEDFKFKCGDKIIGNYESFITITLTFNYIFKSREEINKFKTDIGVSNTINNWLTKGSFKSTDVEYFEKYSGYLSLSIEQFGGSPTLLLNTLGSNLGFCSLSNIQACAEIITNVNSYINSQAFEDQLDHSKWNTRLIANVEALPISIIPGIDTSNYQSDYIGNDLSEARSDLINKLNQVTSDYNYIQGLYALITGDNCETTAIYSNAFVYEVENAITVIRNYLQILIDSNSGVPSCYSDYTNCVDGIAPRLLNLAYDYSEIAVSLSICAPVECDSPGTVEIGVDGFELYDDWYLDNFFDDFDKCYYGCFVTNEYCSMEKEIGTTSDGNELNSNMEFLAGATIAALAGIALI